MSHAVVARPTPLRHFLHQEPYVTDYPIPGDELSNLAERASQVFQHYYDKVTITRQDQILEERFRELAEDWINATSFVSSVSELTKHPAYRAIVDLGQPVVPLLLRELETRPNFWFTALGEITGANPVRERDRGHIERMAQAWLRWGKEQSISW